MKLFTKILLIEFLLVKIYADEDDPFADLVTRAPTSSTSRTPNFEEKQKMFVLSFLNGIGELLFQNKDLSSKPNMMVQNTENGKFIMFSTDPQKSPLPIMPTNWVVKNKNQPIHTQKDADQNGGHLVILPSGSPRSRPIMVRTDGVDNKQNIEVQNFPIHNATIPTGRIFQNLPTTNIQPLRMFQNLPTTNVQPVLTANTQPYYNRLNQVSSGIPVQYPYYFMFQPNNNFNTNQNFGTSSWPSSPYPYYRARQPNVNFNQNELEITMENFNRGLQQFGTQLQQGFENLFCCQNNGFMGMK